MALYDTPIPGVSGYGQHALAAKTAWQNSLARINQKRSGTMQQFGYTGDVNAETGTIGNMRVDPNNPYGQYQDLRSSHADASDLAEEEAISRGLGGGGGLAAQAQRRLRHSFGREDANMGTNLANMIAGLQDEQDQSYSTFQNALWQAEQDAKNNAIAEGAFNPADFSGLEYPGYGEDPVVDDTNPTKPGAQKKPPKKAAPKKPTPRNDVTSAINQMLRANKPAAKPANVYVPPAPKKPKKK